MPQQLPVLPPAEERDFQIYYAKVMLAEARRRRHFNGMHANLLDWAGRARRVAASIDISPVQKDMFANATSHPSQHGAPK